MKVILITDSYVHNQQVENKLSNFLDTFGNHFDICLISNTVVSQEIQDKVNYFIYDSRNQLFSSNFDEIPKLTIFRDFGDFKIETDISGNQPHGLSVLINLFNQIKFCQSVGYIHILRLEIDANFESGSVDIIKGANK